MSSSNSRLLSPHHASSSPAARSRSPSTTRRIPELGSNSDVVSYARLTPESLKGLQSTSTGALWEDKPQRPSIDREGWETDEWEWDNAKSGAGSAFHVCTSHDGHFLYMANSKRFHCLAHTPSADPGFPGEYRLCGSGSGCESDMERITSLCPLTIFMKRAIGSSGSNFLQAFLAVGYSSGYLKIFDEKGQCALSQLVHRASIVKVSMRFCPTSTPDPPDQDEMTILFDDKRAVSIDGLSLWTALRIVTENPHLMAGFGGTQTHAEEVPNLTFKKWNFGSQVEISDAVSCGPTSQTFAPILPTSQNAFAPVNYTARFLAVGSRPMIAYYCTTDQVRSFSLGNVASKVTSVVSSLASTFLWRQTPPPVKEDPALAAANAPATSINAVLTLSDPQRHVQSIIPAPPSAITGKSSMAAVTDSLGRVMVIDIDDGEILRMWKGIRDAQCGWIEVDVDFEPDTNQRIFATNLPPSRPSSPQPQATLKHRTMLFLVIYAPRGVIEIIHMRHGKRVGLIPVPTGLRLLTTAYGVLGGAVHGFRRTESSHRSQCYLMSPTGDVKQIRVPTEAVTSNAVKELRQIRSLCTKFVETKDSSLLDDIQYMICNSPHKIKNQLAAIAFISDEFPRDYLDKVLADVVKIRNLGPEKIKHPSQLALEDLERDDKIRLMVQHRLLLARQQLAKEAQDERSGEQVLKDLEAKAPTDRRLGMIRRLSKRGTLSRSKRKVDGVSDLSPREFLDLFEIFPEDTRSRARNVSVTLAQHISEDRLTKLAHALIGRHVDGLNVDKWEQTIGSLVPLPPSDWERLFVTALDAIPVGTLLANYAALLIMAKNWYSNEEDIAKILQSDVPGSGQPTVLPPPFMILYVLRSGPRIHDGKTTTRVGHALMFANLISDICNQDETTHPTTMKIVEQVLGDLEDCWTLSADDDIILTPFNLDSKESLSASRLLSLRSCAPYTPEEVKQSLNLMQQDLNQPANQTLVQIYQVFDLAKKWRDDGEGDEMRWYRAILNVLKEITDPVIRNAAICGLWIDYIVPLLKTITLMVDKSKKAPVGKLSVRSCGYTEEGVKHFLELTKEFLELIDLDRGKLELMQKHLLDLFNQESETPITATSSFLDGPVGGLLKKLGPADVQGHLIKLHESLIALLEQVYQRDLIGVRPLKHYVPLDTPLFVPLTQPLTPPNEASLNGNDKSTMERLMSLERVLDKEPDASWESLQPVIQAFQLPLDQAELLFKCHELEMGRNVTDVPQAALLSHVQRRLAAIIRSHPQPNSTQNWSDILGETMNWILQDKTPNKEVDLDLVTQLQQVERVAQRLDNQEIVQKIAQLASSHK